MADISPRTTHDLSDDDNARTPASAESDAPASEVEAHVSPLDADRPDSAPAPPADEDRPAAAPVCDPLSDPYATSARDESDAGDSLDDGNGDEDEFAEPPRDPHEGAVPPGYDWPTHGGYLGCLIGLMAACAVAGFVGGTWIPLIAAPSLAKVVISLVVAVGVLVGLGRLGWVLGKRFYREYPAPVRGARHLPPREHNDSV